MSTPYDIIIEPVITEESMNAMAERKYTFKVDKRANKSEIKKAVEKIYPAFEPYQVPFPFIKIRKMKSLWGSCSMYKGTITLNRALIHAPFECIEYVAAHELTHFLYPNHSSHFYNRLSSIMPDYKERKKLLNQQGIYQ